MCVISFIFKKNWYKKFSKVFRGLFKKIVYRDVCIFIVEIF